MKEECGFEHALSQSVQHSTALDGSFVLMMVHSHQCLIVDDSAAAVLAVAVGVMNALQCIRAEPYHRKRAGAGRQYCAQVHQSCIVQVLFFNIVGQFLSSVETQAGS